MSMYGGQRAEPTLKRRLGPLDAVSIGLGVIIGAGVFVLIGTAAGMAGPAVFVSVLISGLSATFTALSFGDLATRLPKAGGAYEYGHELISPPVGFLMGWLFVFGNILVGSTASLLATLSVVLTSVLGRSRVLFAMARNGEIPRTLSQLHGRF